MGHRSEIEDGMGFAGLVPSAAERAAERAQQREIKSGIAAAKRDLATKVLAAVKGERLHENLDNEGDKGYMQAIEDVAAALTRAFTNEGIELDATTQKGGKRQWDGVAGL